MNKTTPQVSRLKIALIFMLDAFASGGGYAFSECLNEYQNEYQMDLERYPQIGTDTHISPTNQSKNSLETGLNCPIPILASKPNRLEP